jgi:SAM-dependent methyltransferase
MLRAARVALRALAFLLLKVSRGLERAGRGLAVASLTRTEVDALSVSEWEAFGRDSPVEQPFAWEADLFARAIRRADSILVVGAGGGRDVLPFLAAGHAVTALDIAPEALRALSERARSRGFTVATIHDSIVSVPLAPATFDVVLFSWFCFCYLHGETERREALLRSESALRPGGRILLSYPFRGDSRPPAAKAPWIARVAARVLGGMETEPGDDYTVSGTVLRPGVFYTHPFRPRDIEDEVKRLGFKVALHDQSASGVGVLVLERRSETGR